MKADVDAAFAKAAHVTKLDIVNNRLIPNAMEPRAAAADYDKGTGNYTLWSTSQNPHVLRLILSAFVLGIPEHKLRVIAPDVGGGFGSKIFCYNEETMVHLGGVPGRPADQVDGRAQRIVHDRLRMAATTSPMPSWRSTRTASSSASRSTRSPTWARTSRPSRRRCRPISTPPCWPASTRRR